MKFNLSFFCRGSEFRTAYGNIDEVHSIVLPKNVNFTALTATVSLRSIRTIMENLCMLQPCTVRELPNKPNIKYVVRLKLESIDMALLPIIHNIKKNGIRAKKTIIFCSTYASYLEVV